MKTSHRLRSTLILSLMIGLGAMVFFLTRSNPAADLRPSLRTSAATHALATPAAPSASTADKTAPTKPAPASTREIALPPPDPAVHAALGALLTDLKVGPIERTTLLARLKALKASIHALPPDVAAATLIAWLDASTDAPTRLGFVVGAEGVMAEIPSFRTCLLDLLGQTDPVASLAYSQDLLAAKPDAEEYALALRNIAWLNPDGSQHALLRQAFLNLLTDPLHAEHPSPGYLEAFDGEDIFGEGGVEVTQKEACRKPDSGNGSCLSDHNLLPAKEEAPKGAIGLPQKDVFTARGGEARA